MALEIRVSSVAGQTREVIVPHRLITHFWRLRHLVWRLAVRDTRARYQGSYLGLIWSLLMPLMMLAIYTFVFGYVFQPKHGAHTVNIGEFAMILFCGIVPFSLLFSDAVSRAPMIVVGQPNLVTRVVFPVEALPASCIVSAGLQFAAGCCVLLGGALVVRHTLGPQVLLLPLVVIPLALLTSGMVFFLASVGVFVRDVGNSVQLALMLLFFLSPVFYRLDNLPQWAQPYMRLNPFTSIIESLRRTVLLGQTPDWPWLGYSLAVSAVIGYLGVAWFVLTKKAFSDVL